MELSLRSSKNSTDVTSFINITLLSTLPTLQSLTDFCFIDNTLEIYRNTSWLNLFIFVAYNISHLKTNFKQKIRDLKLFLFINDIHSNMVYDNCYISDVYSNIIKHFIHGIIYIISNQDFYNDKSNYFSLIDLFILIYQFEKKTVVSQSTREIKELLFPLKKALKETSDQYETTNTNLYHFYFRFLFTNKSYNNISSVFYNKNEVFSNNNSNDSNNHLQLAITINSESEKPILNLSNDNSNMILKPT